MSMPMVIGSDIRTAEAKGDGAVIATALKFFLKKEPRHRKKHRCRITNGQGQTGERSLCVAGLTSHPL
jgi:hypothetical protein